MSSTQVYHPRIGVAAIIRDGDGKFVLGKRKGSHGAGTWQFPGGHLEMGESLLYCAERETLEETGLKVKGIKVIAVTNDVFDAENKHYVTIFVQCEREDGSAQPQVLEPEKCEGWHWVGWEDIRRWCEHHDDNVTPELAQNKCFLPIRDLVKDHPSDSWGLN
ncbi:NUDIX hydrolase domain-like protein [Hypoxylon rubiginosum]|uniref:NUDIX hydrolase domain-like protein n=1 Tax=Hypoxylon rubiginosum TaxID=110542 RepID=A0ACC0CL70_9PEZI|nr:NUDIX hydrolase domain-like protein [Hypoxylon rubiginosum]